jgi:hypothetical protein
MYPPVFTQELQIIDITKAESTVKDTRKTNHKTVYGNNFLTINEVLNKIVTSKVKFSPISIHLSDRMVLANI